MNDPNGFFTKQDVNPKLKPKPLPNKVLGKVASHKSSSNAVDEFIPVTAGGGVLEFTGQIFTKPDIINPNLGVYTYRVNSNDYGAVKLEVDPV